MSATEGGVEPEPTLTLTLKGEQLETVIGELRAFLASHEESVPGDPQVVFIRSLAAIPPSRRKGMLLSLGLTYPDLFREFAEDLAEVYDDVVPENEDDPSPRKAPEHPGAPASFVTPTAFLDPDMLTTVIRSMFGYDWKKLTLKVVDDHDGVALGVRARLTSRSGNNKVTASGETSGAALLKLAEKVRLSR